MVDATRHDKPTLRLSWVSHPARREPLKAALAIIVAIGMAVSVTLWAGLWLGALSFIVIVASVHGFLFPVWYRIYEDHLSVQTFFGAQQRSWKAVRRSDAGKHGVHLSPFSTPNWLDGTRGIYVRFGDNREDVLAAIDGMIESAHGERASSSRPSATSQLDDQEQPAQPNLGRHRLATIKPRMESRAP